MFHRSSRFKLIGAIALAFVVGMATSGREARSGFRLAVEKTMEVEKSYRHNFPLMLRIKKQDGTAFEPASTIKVTYKDSDGKTTEDWPVAYSKFSASNKSMYIWVTAKDPRKKATTGTTPSGTGTGTITVGTNTMTTETSTDPIPVSATSDPEEFP
jgi:hypothetical protein